MRPLVALEDAIPLLFGRRARLAMVPGGADLFRHHERRRIPAQRLARVGDFFRAEGFAVRGLGALLVRRAPADDGLAADDGRLILAVLRLLDGRSDRVGIVTEMPLSS